VLELIAAATGVIIAAITRNSSDDLQEQTADIKSPCNAAEIHDTTLAAAGAKGKNGNDRAGNPSPRLSNRLHTSLPLVPSLNYPNNSLRQHHFPSLSAIR